MCIDPSQLNSIKSRFYLILEWVRIPRVGRSQIISNQLCPWHHITRLELESIKVLPGTCIYVIAMANPSQCALLTNYMHGSHHTDFAGRALNMPKPSQSMSTNEYGLHGLHD